MGICFRAQSIPVYSSKTIIIAYKLKLIGRAVHDKIRQVVYKIYQ